ncbi:hemolysin III [Paucidesulfovibrio gracilis DSM 16080]|uniref:Hemolysin III n=1 Tax=Paucidesulfovibrio gracilis DSM 16080 TaxID=1121449 RepID=A0A1T4X6Q2_9BACT|nr:hemolysin III family protein [Paucidesulfovibrio gracilis]SKA85360.1 hemolysin III [Paucidesulfovibrio gracilis DSM 16080]
MSDSVMRRPFCGLRDPLAGLTHLLGALGGIAALVVLLVRAATHGTAWHVTSFAIFGAAMILLYTASTLYHWIPYAERRTRRLRKLDHLMIFVMIAGTYTPICLVPLRGAWGWSIFGVVWGLALAGSAVKLCWMNAPRWLSTGFYILMGWVVVAAVWPLVQALTPGALLWLLAGGLSYTLGGVVYALRRPDPWPRVFGFHEIFHIFVLLGSFCHFWVMYAYIAQLP